MYIHEQQNWPNFVWDKEKVNTILNTVNKAAATNGNKIRMREESFVFEIYPKIKKTNAYATLWINGSPKTAARRTENAASSPIPV